MGVSSAGPLLLLLSHIPLLGQIELGVRYRILLLPVHALLTAFASISYHTCRGYGGCVMGVALETLTRLDYGVAQSGLCLVALISVSNLSSLDPAVIARYLRAYPHTSASDDVLNEIFWVTTIWSIQLAGCILIAFMFAREYLIVQLVCVIALALAGAMLKVVFAGGPAVIFGKAQWSLAGIGLVCLLIGLAFFPVEFLYDFSHLVWHVFVFIGEEFYVAAFALNATRITSAVNATGVADMLPISVRNKLPLYSSSDVGDNSAPAANQHHTKRVPFVKETPVALQHQRSALPPAAAETPPKQLQFIPPMSFLDIASRFSAPKKA